MPVSNIWSSYKPVADLETYVGNIGEIFYDADTGELRISNGVTPGGLAISGTVTVSNEIDLTQDTIDAIGVAAGGGGGTVELGASSLAALENITVDTVVGNISVDNFPVLQDVRISEPTNGFSELVNTERTPVIERIPVKGVTVRRDITSTTNSGNVTSDVTEYVLSTGTTANSVAQLRTASRGRYQAGTMGQIGLGVRFEEATTFIGDERCIWGYFDDNDGYYFGRDSGGIFTAILRNNIETDKTYSTSWNIDPLDGTGPSQVDWEPDDGNIYQIEYSWYGYGAVLFSVVDRDITTQKQRAFPVHTYRPTQETSIRYPNLPINVRIENDGSARDIDVRVGGRQYSVIGKFAPATRVVSENVLGLAITDTLTPVISVRSKNTPEDLAVSKFFRGFDIVADGDSVYVEVRKNTTLSAGTTTFGAPNGYNPDEVSTETNTGATAFTGGEIIWAGLVGATGGGPGFFAGDPSGARSEEGLTVEFIEDQIVTIAARSITAAGSDISMLLRWEEEW